MYCEVFLFDAPCSIDRPFDYACGDDLSPGAIVRVPFGRGDKLREGIVTRVKAETENAETKPVHTVLREDFFTEEMLGLCFFLREYTLCTFGEAARAVLPPGALHEKLNISTRKTLSLAIPKEDVEKVLSATGRAAIRSEGQREILRYLSGIGSADRELVRALPGVTPAQIAALCEKGLLSVAEDEQIRNPYESYARERDTSEIVLSRAQRAAFDAIEALYLAPEAKCALLHGVTGSGKTKIMMKMIDRTIADGKGVIMLVPEIALTPQTVSLFCRRYGERVAVIHSSLSQGERMDAFRRIRRGDVDLVIGTRSAIFAPVPSLGLIVIDEEHEHTYKSESDPKYHARDVAAYRCGKAGALLLLASATPSLESYYKAEKGIYTLVPLRERYGGAKLPDAVIVDMREELRLGNTSPISDRLGRSLDAVYENEEQAILFLNRRGYNSEVNCKSCGDVLTCPRCSVSLTYHTDARGGRMLCHLCGYSMPTPRVCPSCGSESLSFIGYGTQKVEAELCRFLPKMKTMRMDADTTVGKLAYDRMLDDFREGRADILLGTQMVAKGHDFPRVTLVGVVLADTSLYVSDFRAAERTFSLLTQVIGRAGRAADRGLAVIQTFSPTHEIINLACKQDYEAFYRGEIERRRALSYPPFCDLVSMTVSGEDEKDVFRVSAALSVAVREMLAGEYGKLPFIVFGPFEAGVYKVNEKYRMRMVVKCRLSKTVRSFFRELLLKFSAERKTVLAIDLNPLSV